MLVPKRDFIGLEGVVHLAAGGETPLLARHQAAFQRFGADKASGLARREGFDQTHARVRAHLARLLTMQPTDIALLGSASEGIAQVLSALDWQPGDTVVTAENEFPSGLYALARLRALGVELRTVATPSHYLHADDLIAACDDRTRLVTRR